MNTRNTHQKHTNQEHTNVDIRVKLLFLALGFIIMAALRPLIAWQVYNRATLFYNAGMYKQSIRYLKKTLILSPRLARPNLLLASAYENIGDYNKAIDVYLKYMRINPGDPRSYYYIGCIYAQDYKDYIKALSWFKTTIKVDKKHWQAHIWISICYKLLGKKQMALNNYLNMKEIFPQDKRIDHFIDNLLNKKM